MDRFLISKNKRNASPSTSSMRESRSRSRSPTPGTSTSTSGTSLTDVRMGGERTTRKGKISFVWKYFKKSGDKKYAKCLTCGNEYKTSGNTSNLLDHLKRFHSMVTKKADDTDTISIGENSSSSSSMSMSGIFGRANVRSISPFFKRTICYDDESQRKKDLDKALLHMIVADFQPFSIVKDKGFKKFVDTLDPRYTLPSTFTLSEKLLKEVYLQTYGKLKQHLDSIEYVAITSDSWSSMTMESYLTVTCHYVHDYELKSAVLSTKPLANGVNHTSENLAETLQEIFNEWNIGHKVVCITTDNAANMKKACELLKKKHLPCYAHTINLAVQECIEIDEVRPVIKKVKDIVTFIRTSYVATETFKEEQKAAGKEPLKLIQEVSTRWNSTFYMIQRVLKTNDSLTKALLKLRKAPAPLSVDEIEKLKEIEKMLSCFEEAVKKVSGNNYVTISLIIPLSMGIQTFLSNCLPDLTTEEGKILCKSLLDSTKKRFYPYETRTIPKLGTMLDARFKKDGFQSFDNAANAALLLEQEMYAVINRKNETKIPPKEPTSSGVSEEKGTSIFSFLRERLDSKIKSIKTDVIITKRQYLERNNSPEDTNPLAFWKFAGQDLHPLNELCKQYFCVPATSVESERTFSTAGQIVTERRSRLKSSNVNMLTFLHKNYDNFVINP